MYNSDNLHLPHTDAEFLGAFQLFKHVPFACYTSYFLRLLNVHPSSIAAMEGVSYAEVEKHFSKAKDVLYRRLDSLIEDELRRQANLKPQSAHENEPTIQMVRRMFELVDPVNLEAFRLFKQAGHKKSGHKNDVAEKLGITPDEAKRRSDAARDFFHNRLLVLTGRFMEIDASSPEPWKMLWPFVREVIQMRDYYYEKSRKTTTLEAIINAPQPSPAELREANCALFAQPKSLRTIFLLSEGTNLNPQQIADFLHIPLPKVEAMIRELRFLLNMRMSLLCTRYFRVEKPDTVQLTASQHATVRQALKAISDRDQQIFKMHLAGEPDSKIIRELGEGEKSVDAKIYEIQTQLNNRLRWLMTAWVRLTLNGTPSAKVAVLAAKKRTFMEKRFRRKLGVLEYTLLLMEPEVRDTFMQVHGENRDVKQVAASLGVSRDTVEQQLRGAWHIFHERVRLMIPRFLVLRFKKNAHIDLKRGEYLFAKSVYEALPVRTREFLAEYSLTNDSLTNIALKFNLSQKELENTLTQTDELIASEIQRIVVEKLMRKKNGRTLASRLLQRWKKAYQPLVSSSDPYPSAEQKDAEALQKKEVRLILGSATSLGRKAFWISRTGTASLEDAVLFLGLNEAGVKQAYNDTIELLHQRVEEYVDNVLQKRTVSPGAELLGETAISQTSERNLQAYRRFYIDGEPLEEIAQRIDGATANAVRRWIEEARKAFHKRIEQLALKLTDPPHGYDREHIEVCDDIMYVASLQHAKNEAGSRRWDMALKASRPAVEQLQQSYEKKVEIPPDTPPSVAKALKSRKFQEPDSDAPVSLGRSVQKSLGSVFQLFTPLLGLRYYFGGKKNPLGTRYNFDRELQKYQSLADVPIRACDGPASFMLVLNPPLDTAWNYVLFLPAVDAKDKPRFLAREGELSIAQTPSEMTLLFARESVVQNCVPRGREVRTPQEFPMLVKDGKLFPAREKGSTAKAVRDRQLINLLALANVPNKELVLGTKWASQTGRVLPFTGYRTEYEIAGFAEVGGIQTVNVRFSGTTPNVAQMPGVNSQTPGKNEKMSNKHTGNAYFALDTGLLIRQETQLDIKSTGMSEEIKEMNGNAKMIVQLLPV